VRLTPTDAATPPLPWRRLARIAAGGLICALLVLAGGWGIQRAVFGSDDRQARARVEDDVRSTFDGMARRLREMALAVSEPTLVRAASDDDAAAAHQLLTRAAEVVARDSPGDAALTVYDADGRPVAWAGRPSELLADRLQRGEAWFPTPVAQGLRLVYVQPVLDDGMRVGTIAVERPIPSIEGSTLANSGLQGTGDDAYRVPTMLAPVSIQLPFEGAPPTRGDETFDVQTPSGQPLLTASVAPGDLASMRERWRLATWSGVRVVLAITLLLLAAPILDWRNRLRSPSAYTNAVLVLVACIVATRFMFFLAAPADWSDAMIFSGVPYASALLGSLLASPFDFVLTAGSVVAIVVLLLYAVEAWRVYGWLRRQSPNGAGPLTTFAVTQLLCGVVVAVVLLGHEALLRDTVSHTRLDLLQLSLNPWNASRIALQVGLILAHIAAMGLAVLLFRTARVGWRIPRHDIRLRVLMAVCWLLPLVIWQAVHQMPAARRLPLLMAAVAAVVLAASLRRLVARYRHGSQAFRLTLLTLPLIAPAFAFYPTVVQLAGQAKTELVETGYAPEVRSLRQTVQQQLQISRDEIDRFPDLVDLVTTPVVPGTESLTDRAFRLWQTTALARYPITSSIELYGPDGQLVSRFAFNLPEDPTATPLSEDESCEWQVLEEVAPFFAEDRRVLHAGRALCSEASGGKPLGSIVIHAMPDFENLPFISSRSPYMELLRPAYQARGEGFAERDVEFAAYGWSQTQFYPVAGRAWSLPDDVFARVEESRTPFWATLRRGQDNYNVYLLNDRGGIYALGFPVISALGHLVNLAEVTVLAVVTYVLLLLLNAMFDRLGRRVMSAPALLREVRASFYRKLFLAFVLAVIVPVVALVLVTRNYVAGQMEASIEQEAIRTATAAGRVVEDLAAPRAAQQGFGVDDNLMVWVSRLIDQDVNIFMGPRLQATSERNLFASGLLPTRTPAEVYRALGLRNEAALVTRERIGQFEYLVAATPLAIRQLGILTVPLTSRQREIDQQLETLDRRALLAALLFILGGASLGYYMAERISDPVSRLTRATRRIARGDLDARIAATSSDELRRLVEAFNSMAADLQRQRIELERTHRLEAWAEMARQVAHEIKNPLTPIQLNAEHLRRVHADRGEPLGPVVQDCVATILTQVKLLRQISSEFSSFASSPTAKRAEVDVAALVREVLEPYRQGLERIRLDVELPDNLPHVSVDRTLVSRALVNIVENALHAMPGSGSLTVRASQNGRAVRVRVTDSGAGMDAEALARAFEPYFSTKAAGTGLGLPIAKRNVELSGGSISMSSERDKGTTVEVSLPIAETGVS
jgi:signal transduction histidine kinase